MDLGRGLFLAPLLDLLLRDQALAGDARQRAEDLRAQLFTTSAALRRGALDPRAWQEASAQLCAEVSSAQLLRQLHLEPTLERLEDLPQRPRSLTLTTEGLGAAAKGVRHRLFTFERGQAIVPHGHDHLVSLFIVLRGRFRARHYDRLADRREHIVIRPTIDRHLDAGGQTSVSEVQDNVHWFTALSDDALLYNLSVDLSARARQPNARPGRVYLDPEGPPGRDGTILAPRSDRRRLRTKYDAPAPTMRAEL